MSVGLSTMTNSQSRDEQRFSLLKQRWQKNGHRGGVIWFTGLSGSGKSTLAMALERCLFDEGFEVFVLDGDNLRHGLNSNLGFSPEDREENIRRVGEVAALMANSGFVVLSAFISPYKADRDIARSAVGEGFNEVYLDPGLEACERRDPKGLYKKARAGEIPQFTGISAPYEEPEHPELRLNTAELDIIACVDLLKNHVMETFKLRQ
jgi:bifunctional enzyme CysN/CysC